VYLFRERMVLQGMIYTPIPPLYFAVDEKLVSIMPLGSYVKLSLPPGQHKFYRLAVTGDIFTPYGLVSAGVDLNLEPGKVYYVGDQQKLVSWNFGRVEAKNGEGMVKEAQLAKLLHAPATVAEFRRRIEAKNVKPNQSPQGGGTPPAPERASPLAAAADALPSAKQVSNFLEGLAAVALVGLVVVAAVAGARGMGPPPQQPFNTIQTARQQAPAQAEAPRLSPVSPLINYESVGSWRNSAGTLSDILRSKDKAVLRITSTGVVYDIENSRIKGSDGSRYTVIGPNIFSDTGASYQVIGNSLFTSDGRSCTKIGINVTCR
jgi:hypothetical protein